MNEKIKGDVGVIIGRFQCPELHEAHKELIQSVVDRHPKVILVLGLAPIKVPDIDNPLDLEMRRHVIHDAFPNILVAYIKNVRDDAHWSRKLDEVVNDHLSPTQSAVLYGSRDSFIKAYSGKYPTVELESKRIISASEIRKAITKKVMATKEFRCGVIWTVGNQYPICYPTVDIAILKQPTQEILLGRRKEEPKYRFIGGFAEPNSPCFEHDAIREVFEETELEITDPAYVGSFFIKDWRYEGSRNKIKTLLFKANYKFGVARPSDDIDEVRWFKYDVLRKPEWIIEEHQPLALALANNLGV